MSTTQSIMMGSIYVLIAVAIPLATEPAGIPEARYLAIGPLALGAYYLLKPIWRAMRVGVRENGGK